MSQHSDTSARDVALGLYGPDNPPPPPPGKPHSMAACKEDRRSVADSLATPTKHHAKPYRKLNSRQRKERKQEMNKAKLNHNGRRERSRSPVREADRTSRGRYRTEPDVKDFGSGDYRERTPVGVPLHNLQPLKDARQFTPDQITDETYGRLSPGMDYRDRDQHLYGQTRTRNEWPGEQSWSPRQNVDEKFGQSLQKPASWDRYGVALLHDTGTNRDKSRRQYEKTGSMTHPPPPFAGRAFDVEDEVDWGDDAPVNIPQSGEPKPQNMAEMRPMPYPEGERINRVSSSPRREQPWQQRSWTGTDHHRSWKGKGNQTSWKAQQYSQLVSRDNPNEGPSSAQLGKTRNHDLGDQYHVDMTPFKKPVAKAQSREALLAPDPALAQGHEVPDTVYDLRKYDAHITALHKGLPVRQRFINGNGKVAPFVYGSVQGSDLGLCFSTFCTSFKCEMGVKCAWRHHPLTKAEREWILARGGTRGKSFLGKLVQFWAVPEVPVPGASMHDR